MCSTACSTKGIVIDAWVRVSLVGIDLITVEARVVVASIDTYLKYAEAVSASRPISRPRPIEGRSYDEAHVGECLAAVTAWPARRIRKAVGTRKRTSTPA